VPRFLMFLALTVFSWITVLAGQDNPGTPSFSAYDTHVIDTINLQNLNVVLNVPILTKAGAFPFTFGMSGDDSYVYYTNGRFAPGILAVPFTSAANGTLGATGPFVLPATTQPNSLCPGGSGTSTKYSNWYLQFADGTKHSLPTGDITYGGGNCTTSFTDQVIDGTGWTVGLTGNTVTALYGRDGKNLDYLGLFYQILDPNGNSVSKINGGSAYGDTTGGTALNVTSTGWSWPDANGGSPAVNVTNTSYTLQSSFGCTNIGEYTTGSHPLVTSIGFPDNTSLSLQYEGSTASSTGRVSQITLRGGGTIVYNYNPNSGPNGGLNCPNAVPNTMTRTTSDGTTTYTWAQFGSGVFGNTTTKVDAVANKTIYTFSGLGAAAPTIQALTEVRYFENIGSNVSPAYSSTPTKQVIYCYNSSSPTSSSCPTAIVHEPITEVDTFTSLDGASSSRQQTQYDGGPNGTSPHYGNVTYSAQYGFGGTSPIQATTITYGSSNGSGACSAIGHNVNDKPCTIITTHDGSPVESSQFTYNAFGNVLKTYVSPNGGTSFLSNVTLNNYNSNGTPSATYDLANNKTTYTYDSASCSYCSNVVFPTSISRGGVTTYATWSGLGAVKLTDKDANGNTTTYTYADPWNRLTSIQDPLGNIVNKSYSATSVQSTFAFGSSINDTTTTTDGYGRPILTQTQQGSGSSNYDTVTLGYGGKGNGMWQSGYTLPCTATLNGTCTTTGVEQTFIDILNRTRWSPIGGNGGSIGTFYSQNDAWSYIQGPSGENNKEWQNEYDGLGRITKSCAIGNGSTTPCGQATGSYNGVTTSTAYTSATGSQTVATTRGVQTRSQTVDGLGRVTSIYTPEGGTATNVYETVPSACTSYSTAYPGKLIYSLSANGNYRCYKYDSLGRATVVTGISGTSKLCKRFFYDNSSGATGTIPTGITLTNPYGRMVEAETDNCTSPIIPITDEWSSYDKDGRVTDMWEKTPHSGIYYHSVATFAGNGVALTVKLANPILYTMTYGLDGEGRPSTLKGNSTTVVSATTFNGASQPIYIDLGTGTDQDDYVYQPSTGLMTKWTFQVGTTGSETGTLTWNWSDETLNNLVIVDGFNTGGSQTCHFNPTDAPGTGYDDLGRLVGVDCGSGGWGQTFSYDQYDNLTKSVISGRTGVTWNPGYTASNNHYSSGTNYDGSGNITWDTFHNYTWDQFGKLSSIDSSACGTNGECITYDALGRMVETSYNGTYTEIWYTQLGKGVYMHGSTPYYAYWPTPGNGTVEVNGNAVTFFYMHKDWLGNARISSVIVNPAVVSDQAYAPFGELYDTLNVGAGVPGQMFTGDTQDILTGIFDTPNRELNASQGRWLSPDPAGAGWNQYAYATNPNGFIDPSGLTDCPQDKTCGIYGEGGGGDPSVDPPIPIGPPVDPGGPINYGPGNPGNGCANGDSSCGGGGGNLWNGGSGVSNGPLWNLSEMQQGENVYDNCVAFNFHCDSSGRPTGGDSNYTINVYCGGSLSNVTCQPPLQAIFGSSAFSINLLYPGLAPGDQPVGLNIWQGQAGLWKAANGTMIDLTAAYAGGALIAVTPAAVEVAGSVLVTAAATAETYGVPVFATSLWIQQNWSTLMNWRKIFNWGYQQCQAKGPCP
jgi:RHS repeat-associated protein